MFPECEVFEVFGRFVLLDESAVPLYPAAAVYLQLMGEAKSRVAACVVSSLIFLLCIVPPTRYHADRAGCALLGSLFDTEQHGVAR